MFKIIVNYKLFFKSLLRNDFFSDNENMLYIDIPDEDNSGDNTNEIIKEIINDKVINGKDLLIIKELSYKLNGKKKESYRRIRDILNISVQEMLEDGFSVKGEDSYRAISTLLIDLKGVMMPEYKEIKDSIKNGNFSLAIDGSNLIVYKPSSYENIAKKVGEINLMTGEYITDSSWYEIDYEGNNNKINLDNEVIDFEVLKGNYQKEKVSDRPNGMLGQKPIKIVENVDNIIITSENSEYKAFVKKLLNSLKQIKEWNKKVEGFKNKEKQEGKKSILCFNERNISERQKVPKKTENLEKNAIISSTSKVPEKKENSKKIVKKIEKDNTSSSHSIIEEKLSEVTQKIEKTKINKKEEIKQKITQDIKQDIKEQKKIIKNNLNERIKDAVINQAIHNLKQGKSDSVVILPLGKGDDKMDIKLEKLTNKQVNLLDREGKPIIDNKENYYQVRLDTKYFDGISDIEIPLIANSGTPDKKIVLDAINKIKIEYKKSLKQRNKNNLEINEILKEMFGEEIEL